MTADEVLASIRSALDPLASVTMIFAGFLCGALVFWQAPSIRAQVTPPRFMVFLLITLGLLFFASRGLALFFDGSLLWPRNIGFAIQWVAYIAALLAGIAFRRRYWQ